MCSESKNRNLINEHSKIVNAIAIWRQSIVDPPEISIRKLLTEKVESFQLSFIHESLQLGKYHESFWATPFLISTISAVRWWKANCKLEENADFCHKTTQRVFISASLHILEALTQKRCSKKDFFGSHKIWSTEPSRVGWHTKRQVYCRARNRTGNHGKLMELKLDWCETVFLAFRSCFKWRSRREGWAALSWLVARAFRCSPRSISILLSPFAFVPSTVDKFILSRTREISISLQTLLGSASKERSKVTRNSTYACSKPFNSNWQSSSQGRGKMSWNFNGEKVNSLQAWTLSGAVHYVRRPGEQKGFLIHESCSRKFSLLKSLLS